MNKNFPIIRTNGVLAGKSYEFFATFNSKKLYSFCTSNHLWRVNRKIDLGDLSPTQLFSVLPRRGQLARMLEVPFYPMKEAMCSCILYEFFLQKRIYLARCIKPRYTRAVITFLPRYRNVVVTFLSRYTRVVKL